MTAAICAQSWIDERRTAGKRSIRPSGKCWIWYSPNEMVTLGIGVTSSTCKRMENDEPIEDGGLGGRDHDTDDEVAITDTRPERMMVCVQHRDGWGVPPAQMQAGSRFPLQVRAGLVPRPAVGFPLQSLTRSTSLTVHWISGWASTPIEV